MSSPEPRGLLKALWSMYLEFAVNTGIHGLKYITEDGRRLVERLLWIVVAACGLIGAIFMASNFWLRFSNSPTRASVETNHYPTWRVPFPAVTLCNANRIFRSKAEELLDTMDLPEGFTRQDALKMFDYIQQLIQPLPENNVLSDKEAPAKFQALLDSYNYTVDKVMMRLDQGCETMLQRCKWKGVIRNCTELFEERKSFIGYCCSFNYRAIKENKTTNGTVKLVEVQRPVQRTRYYSHRMGLTVLLNPEINDYFHSTLFSAGIRMLVHSSDEYPDDAALEKILPVSRELLLRVTATSTYCTEAVRQVAPSIRGCVFPGEVKLKYFPLYSATNCLTECRMAYLHSTCNCTPFYYPSAGEYRTCNLLDIDCLNSHYFTLHTRKESGTRKYRRNQTTLSCNCPALCNDVSYDVQFSTGDFKASQFQRSSFFDGMNITNRILFHFYFGNHVTVRTRRDIISSWNDLLSSLGGVFSLFLGCSFMSVIEIIYFFTLRLYLRYRSAQSVDPVESVTTLQGRLSGMKVESGVALSVLTGEPNGQRRNVLAENQEEFTARHRFF